MVVIDRFHCIGETKDIDDHEFEFPSLVQKKWITNGPKRKMKT